MIDNTYAYLIGTIVFFVPWVIFFYLRKDLRREMLLTSIAIAFGSVFTAYYWWTKDWWHPETITGTSVGIEDFLLGFSNGGIGAVAYEVFFKKREYKIKDNSSQVEGLAITLLTFSLLSFLFWGFELSSFIASSIAQLAGILLMFYYRRDLLWNGLFSGVLMVLISIPAYLIPEWLSPGTRENSWHYELLSNIRVLGIPIEDLIFYFIFGMWIGPLYELYYSKGLRKYPKKK